MVDRFLPFRRNLHGIPVHGSSQSFPIKCSFLLHLSLQALVGLLKHNVIPTSRESLATLSERCRDPAVSVKKKALQCVGELLAVSVDQQINPKDRKRRKILKKKKKIQPVLLWFFSRSPGEARVQRRAEGVAAGRGAGGGGLRELGAGQGPGGSRPAAAQPRQAVLSRPPPRCRSAADLGPAGAALSRVPGPQVGPTALSQVCVLYKIKGPMKQE